MSVCKAKTNICQFFMFFLHPSLKFIIKLLTVKRHSRTYFSDRRQGRRRSRSRRRTEEELSILGSQIGQKCTTSLFYLKCGIYVGYCSVCNFMWDICGIVSVLCDLEMWDKCGIWEKSIKNQCGIHVGFLLAPRPNFHFFTQCVLLLHILTGEWMMQG